MKYPNHRSNLKIPEVFHPCGLKCQRIKNTLAQHLSPPSVPSVVVPCVVTSEC